MKSLSMTIRMIARFIYRALFHFAPLQLSERLEQAIAGFQCYAIQNGSK